MYSLKISARSDKLLKRNSQNTNGFFSIVVFFEALLNFFEKRTFLFNSRVFHLLVFLDVTVMYFCYFLQKLRIFYQIVERNDLILEHVTFSLF